MHRYAFNGVGSGSRANPERRSGSRFESRTWFFLLAIILSVAGITYLVLVNKTATQGFIERDLEKHIQTIQSENGKLEVQLAEMRSLETVKARIASEVYEPIARIHYFDAVAPVVAIK